MNDSFKADSFRATHSASVAAMLAPHGISRPVRSAGNQFYNRDNWTARNFFKVLCEDGFRNGEIKSLIERANTDEVWDKAIVIASTPDQLPRGVAMSLIGGAYHEAWHTLWSRRAALTVSDVKRVVELYNQQKPEFWAKSFNQIMKWSNIVEDIRIERIGCKKYPGVVEKMESLQDLILKMEKDAFSQSMPDNLLLTIVSCAFRDIGLGYVTTSQINTINWYRQVCPEAVEVVNGLLGEFLQRSINLGEQDDMACMEIAMEILIAIQNLASESPESESESNEGQQGEQGQGEQGQKGQKGQKGQGAGDEQGDEQGAGDEQGDDEGEGQGAGDEQGQDDGDDEGDDEGEGLRALDDEGDDEGDEQDAGDDDGDGDGCGSAGAQGSGGKQGGDQDSDMKSLAESIIEAILNGEVSGDKDLSEALAEAIKNAVNENVRADDYEQPWRPVSSEEDVIAAAEAKSEDLHRKIRKQVRNVTSAIKARLRNKFLAARAKCYTHGVRKGFDMSERRMVDSIIEIKSGMEPTRPDYKIDTKNDCSIAVAVVVDQSGSMTNGNLYKSVRLAAYAIADSISALGAPVLVVGPRTGSRYSNTNDASGCHRYSNVEIDIFKNWDEGMNVAGVRFGSTRADGGTPLEDGIQYALQSLNNRKERHRIVICLTDGLPDNVGVVRHQVRVAGEAKVKVVGLGLKADPSDTYIDRNMVHTFGVGNTIVTESMDTLPNTLVSYLEGVIFPQRARKINISGGYKASKVA